MGFEIQMVDLKKQYQKIRPALEEALKSCLESAAFINGPEVKSFQAELENYLGVKHVIPCGNGTDALQIALMALGLKAGDEVIVPAFTYVATAEVIALLGLSPVMVDVDPHTFNISAAHVEAAISSKTKAIVPVHLFGQSSDMEDIMLLANKHGLHVVEDNAQAIGSDYTFKGGKKVKSGTIGHIGCTSFYPSKNLGCYGDGGALFCNDDALAQKIRMTANHGQSKRYYHDIIGVNSRLDAIQAAILRIKLRNLDDYISARQSAAAYYDKALGQLNNLKIPVRQSNANHVFHQYTLLVQDGRRDALKDYLQEKGIPSMIYYPVPLYKQEAFKPFIEEGLKLAVTEELCNSVISLPMHTELEEAQLAYICEQISSFFQ